MSEYSKPNRYNVASIQAQQTLGGDVMQSAEDGQYVEWRDYAWLLASHDFVRDQWKDLDAEKERSTTQYNSIIDQQLSVIADLKAKFDEYRKAATIAADSVIDERNHLKAEVERLRKVGDAMAREIRTLSPIDDYSSGIIKAWNAAKEGKQS